MTDRQFFFRLFLFGMKNHRFVLILYMFLVSLGPRVLGSPWLFKSPWLFESPWVLGSLGLLGSWGFLGYWVLDSRFENE